MSGSFESRAAQVDFSKLKEHDVEALFLEQYSVIDQAIGAISRRYRLTPDDAGELRAWVLFRIVQNDYAALRSYRGGCRLSTYWYSVVRNLLRDFLNRNLGKWRPSAKARRSSADTEHLERLTQRDGFALAEAIAIVRRNHGSRRSEAELYTAATALPTRSPGRRFENLDHLPLLSNEPNPEDLVEDRDRRRLRRRLRQAMAEALGELSTQDREILKWAFVDGLSLAAIARRSGLPQRGLYGRRDRCLARLRRALDRRHIDWPDVAPLFDGEPAELDLWSLDAAAPTSRQHAGEDATRCRQPTAAGG